ncbi:hypothetical protein NDU88_004867, partial [Pleurodeles waltl]
DSTPFPQYVTPSRFAMPFLGPVKDMIFREWKEVDKAQVPHFLQKLYLLEGQDALPRSVLLDSILATLIGKTALNPEHCTLSDATDQKVDSGLKRAFSVGNLTLRAGILLAYSAQSLVQECSELLSV